MGKGEMILIIWITFIVLGARLLPGVDENTATVSSSRQRVRPGHALHPGDRWSPSERLLVLAVVALGVLAAVLFAHQQ